MTKNERDARRPEWERRMADAVARSRALREIVAEELGRVVDPFPAGERSPMADMEVELINERGY